MMIVAQSIEEGDGTYIVDIEGNIYRKLIPNKSVTGYLRIGLRDKRNSRHWYGVHRIVAKAFIKPDPNRPYVNHIDGNKLNNRIDNLEWCTQSENAIHAFKMNLRRPTRSIPVDQFDLQGNFVKRYDSQAEAARAMSVSQTSIHHAIAYGRTSCGYYWRWAVENE